MRICIIPYNAKTCKHQSTPIMDRESEKRKEKEKKNYHYRRLPRLGAPLVGFFAFPRVACVRVDLAGAESAACVSVSSPSPVSVPSSSPSSSSPSSAVSSSFAGLALLLCRPFPFSASACNRDDRVPRVVARVLRFARRPREGAGEDLGSSSLCFISFFCNIQPVVLDKVVGSLTICVCNRTSPS